MLAARFADTGPILTTAERAAADRSWTYGHIVVDEAQELSPMAWRVLLLAAAVLYALVTWVFPWVDTIVNVQEATVEE